MFINAGDRITIEAILHHRRQDENRRVTLPPLWRGKERPGENYEATYDQWQCTDRSLQRQGVRAEYHAAIEKWVADGHAEWLEPGTMEG